MPRREGKGLYKRRAEASEVQLGGWELVTWSKEESLELHRCSYRI